MLPIKKHLPNATFNKFFWSYSSYPQNPQHECFKANLMLSKKDGWTALETEVFSLTTSLGEAQTEATKIFPVFPPLVPPTT